MACVQSPGPCPTRRAQVSGGLWLALAAAFHFQLRRAVIILRKLGALASFIVRPLYWLSQVGSRLEQL